MRLLTFWGARSLAKTWGVPDFKFLVLPHPIANLTPEQMGQRAAEIAPQVVDFLLKGQQAA
jgi:hypothetical protein